LVLDEFAPFKPLDLLLPFRNSYRPEAVTLGIVAMYGTVLILTTSWIRKKMSTRFWRAIHLLAVPMFTIAMLHGIFAGTDTGRPWMFFTYIGTGAITVFLVLVRGLTAGFRPERAPRPEHARAAAPVVEMAEPDRETESVGV
jgi:DMSO/TMAO reductase YedYZ heme-binding membrane subunit